MPSPWWNWWDVNVYVPSPFPATPYPPSLIAFLEDEPVGEPDGGEGAEDGS